MKELLVPDCNLFTADDYDTLIESVEEFFNEITLVDDDLAITIVDHDTSKKNSNFFATSSNVEQPQATLSNVKQQTPRVSPELQRLVNGTKVGGAT